MAQGVSLLAELPHPTSNMARRLALSDTERNRDILQDLLGRYMKENIMFEKEVSDVELPAPITVQASPEKGGVPGKTTPDNILLCLRLRERLHARLEYATDTERYNMAVEMFSLQDELDKHYTGPTDAYVAKKDKPSQRQLRQIMNWRSYISKYKRLLVESVTEKARVNYRNKIDLYQKKIRDVSKPNNNHGHTGLLPG